MPVSPNTRIEITISNTNSDSYAKLAGCPLSWKSEKKGQGV